MAKKILLADDSLTIQKVVELTFSDSDYELVCVSNGQRALDRVREVRPDLILADAVMPEKNGYEVCEAIKGDPSTARIPVVLLSGTFEPFDRDRAERIGADAIVSKPFDSHQLLAQVDALLAKAPAAAPEPAASFPVPQTTAGIAIPPVVEPSPRAASPSEEAPFDTGFSAEDFTASIRAPSHRTPLDPFEEDYVRGDVDSAIEAFEKAHPRFGLGSGLDEPARSGRDERSDPAPPAPVSVESPATEPSSWLADEPERSPERSALFAPPSETTAPLAIALDPLDAGIASPPHGPADERAQILGLVARPDEPGPGSGDDIPTMEFPRPAIDRRAPSGSDRSGDPKHEDHEDRDEDESEAPTREMPARRPAVEITQQDAETLFDVGHGNSEAPPEVSAAPSSGGDGHEPSPLAVPFGSAPV